MNQNIFDTIKEKYPHYPRILSPMKTAFKGEVKILVYKSQENLLLVGLQYKKR